MSPKHSALNPILVGTLQEILKRYELPGYSRGAQMALEAAIDALITTGALERTTTLRTHNTVGLLRNWINEVAPYSTSVSSWVIASGHNPFPEVLRYLDSLTL